MIRPFDKPLAASGGIAVLKGNLSPTGAVLKPSAASPSLMRHRGRAVVFENIEHYNARIKDPALDVDASCVLVLKNCGPKGYPGMAEVGNMGLPPKVLQTGRDRHGPHLRRAHERHCVRHRRCSTYRRKRRPAVRSRSCGRRHDRARRPRAARCGSTSATTSLPRGRRRGSRRSRSCRPVATLSCTSSTCSRRIKAPISIFSSGAAVTPWPANRTETASSFQLPAEKTELRREGLLLKGAPTGAPRRSGAGRWGPASDGDGGSGGAKPPG